MPCDQASHLLKTLHPSPELHKQDLSRATLRPHPLPKAFYSSLFSNKVCSQQGLALPPLTGFTLSSRNIALCSPSATLPLGLGAGCPLCGSCCAPPTPSILQTSLHVRPPVISVSLTTSILGPTTLFPVTSLTQLFTQGRPRVWERAAIHAEVQGLCRGGQHSAGRAQVSCVAS